MLFLKIVNHVVNLYLQSRKRVIFKSIYRTLVNREGL